VRLEGSEEGPIASVVHLSSIGREAVGVNDLASKPAAGELGGTISVTVERPEKTVPSAAETAEAVRVRRLREDARRPISVNLAEGIALSHTLMRFTGSARKA
jgi:hypothetical protein